MKITKKIPKKVVPFQNNMKLASSCPLDGGKNFFMRPHQIWNLL
jgi:hypothetical protein